MEINLTIDFDFDAFEAEVYAAARAVFTELQRERRDETFYTFNFLMGQVTDNVSIIANTEEELELYARREVQRDKRTLDLPYSGFKVFSRHLWHNFAITVFPNDKGEHAKRFAKANDMLYEQSEYLIEMAMELVDEGDVDEDDYDDFVRERFDEPVEERLIKVLQRLDKEGVFEMTNRRENIHLGIQHPVDYSDILPGPFFELNPAKSCRRYKQDAAIFQRAHATLYG